MRSLRCSALVALIVALAACGDGEDETRVVAESDAAVEGASEVNCGGSVFEFSALSDAPSASSLPEGPARAVDDAGAPAFDASQDWKVVHRSDERVDLVRELEEPFDNGGGDVRTHESRRLEPITGADDVPDGTWLLMSDGSCTPRLVTEADLGRADLTLADSPSPDAISIGLLVHERACASGESAEGRIEIVELDETTEQVRLHIGVRPREGNGTCPGNPPTPFSVELSEPLGDREIVDASTVPPRPLMVESNR